ncbi:hypothetical protein [Mycolicibacterium sp. CH28]|uniref:hypothetical protein n=1 Tax=Mycolicibacterium sp. CH28 TaxID=2512237 RepID=UPI001386B326|nr:hypothetical protein [Mycolicibacterium sp. CH28]
MVWLIDGIAAAVAVLLAADLALAEDEGTAAALTGLLFTLTVDALTRLDEATPALRCGPASGLLDELEAAELDEAELEAWWAPVSAWATPPAPARAAPTPTVNAPAPSQVLTPSRRCCRRCADPGAVCPDAISNPPVSL